MVDEEDLPAALFGGLLPTLLLEDLVQPRTAPYEVAILDQDWRRRVSRKVVATHGVPPSREAPSLTSPVLLLGPVRSRGGGHPGSGRRHSRAQRLLRVSRQRERARGSR
ncbi:MAG TPA: hypothetical protein VMM81_00180, partial [Acidimicrobiia bacterium]|nr:hypothetical protein [Acidimicrobiia bacterium]